MSMEILRRIASDTSYSETTIPSSTTEMVQVCQANPTRYSLSFSTTAFGGLVVTTQSDISTTGGIDIKFPGIVTLTVKDFGALVQAAWYVRPRGTTNDLSVFEVFYNH